MMEEYEEDDMFDSSVTEDFSQKEDEDDEDPEASAFMRGVKEAQQIRESTEEEDEETQFIL